MPCLQLRLATLPNKQQLSKLASEVCNILNKPAAAMLMDVQQSNVTMGTENGAVCHLYSAALTKDNQPLLSRCIGENLKSLDIEPTNHYIFFHKMESSNIGWNLILK
eukprot:NODE_111_length_18624_cov_1.285020.p17 type:complete len:107 gc:universal NODE_111_length_18624_cov_1.285020:9402-9722(+)